MAITRSTWHRWFSFIAALVALAALVACGQPAAPRSEGSPSEATYTGGDAVTALAGEDGRVTIVSRVEGAPDTRLELQFRDAQEAATPGVSVVYSENDRGRAELRVIDPQRRYAPLFLAGTPAELEQALGTKPATASTEIGRQELVTVISGVVYLADLLLKFHERKLAHQVIEGFVETGEDLCGEDDVHCVCATVDEIAAFQKSAEVVEGFWGDVAVSAVMFALSKGVGDSLPSTGGTVVEAVGIIQDSASIVRTVSSLGHAETILAVAGTTTEFNDLRLDEELLVRLLEFEGEGRGLPTWRAVQVMNRGCGIFGTRPGTLDVTYAPQNPTTGEDLVFTVDVGDPIEEGVDVFLRVMSAGGYPEFARWVPGKTNEAGRVQFRVPPHVLSTTPVLDDVYEVVVPSRDLSFASSLEWQIGLGTPSPTIWSFEPVVNVVEVGEEVRFRYLVSQRSIYQNVMLDLDCAIDFGDGTIDADPPCVGTTTPTYLPWTQAWHTYDEPGLYTATLTVQNVEGGTDSVRVPIFVHAGAVNSAPVVEALEVTPPQPRLGETVTVRWSVSDPDGDHLSCSVGFGDGSPTERVEPCGADEVLTHQYHSVNPGGHLLVLTVMDGKGATGGAIASVPVTADGTGEPPAPSITSFAASPSRVRVGEPVRMTWTATGDGDVFSCVLDPDPGRSGDEVTPSTCIGTHEQVVDYPAAGTYTPRLVVTGSLGGSDASTATVTVDPASSSSGPTAQLVVNPPQTIVGAALDLDASGSVPPSGGRIVRYEFETGDGRTQDRTSSVWRTSYAAVGEYDACVVVVDDAGGRDENCQLVTISTPGSGDLPNLIIDAYWINGTRFDDTGVTTLNVDADERLEVELQWSNALGAAPLASTDVFRVGLYLDDARVKRDTQDYPQAGIGEATFGFDPYEIEPGLYTLSMRLDYENAVAESNESDNTRSIRLRVDPPPNQSPTAAFDFVVDDLTVQFTDRSTDPNGSGDIVSWAWTFGDGRASSTRNPTVTYDAAGTYAVALTVTDQAGARDSITQSVVATDPIRVSVTPATATIPPSSTLLLTANVTGAADPSVTWSATCGTVPTDGNPVTYTAPAAVVGGETCIVRATSVADEDAWAEATVTVQPLVSVSVEPASATLRVGASRSFTASVVGSGDTGVTWTSSCGSISGSGNTVTYTAPGTEGTCDLVATSVAEPAVSATAVITVTSAESLILTIDTALGEGTGFTLPLRGNVDVSIDWGDGTATTETVGGDFTHEYASEGEYTIRIDGDLGRFGREPWEGHEDAEKMVGVASWGDLGLTSLAGAFYEATNLVFVPADLPSTVTDTSLMFAGARSFDQPIETWDTSSVTRMSDMFSNAVAFDQPLDGWEVGGVTSFAHMFYGARAFNQPLGSWNTRSAVWVSAMFYDAASFNQPIGSWDTANVVTMANMFNGATAFDQPLDGWNTGNVVDMSQMFASAAAFNHPIGSWDTSNVTNMSYLFGGAVAFDQPLNTWDTRNVTDMSSMFNGATTFDRPLDAWHTGNVVDMNGMFAYATRFNQDLSGWCVALIPTEPGSFAWEASAWTLPKPAWGTCPDQPPPPAVEVSIEPTSVTLPAAGTQSFVATVTGTNDTAVTWNATCGSISGSGTTIEYTAPDAAGSCTVTATSDADSSKSASAGVTVMAAPVVDVTIDPTSATLVVNGVQSFTATVTGTADTSVSWTATCGRVDGEGGSVDYTAPSSVPLAGTCSVMVTSLADTTRRASATVTVVGDGTEPTTLSATTAWTAATHHASAMDLSFEAGTGRIAMASARNRAVLLDREGQRIDTDEVLVGASSGVDWSPDGRWLAVSGMWGVRVYDVELGGTIMSVGSFADASDAVRFDRTGTLVAGTRRPGGGGGDGGLFVKVWDVATGTEVHAFESPGYSYVNRLAWSPTADLLAAAETSGSRVWNTSTGAIVRDLPPAVDLDWRHDGAALVLAHETTVTIIDLDGTEVAQWTATGPLRSIRWAPDGGLVAGTNDDGQVFVWNAADGTLVGQHAEHVGPVLGLAWDDQGSEVFSAGFGGAIVAFELPHGVVRWKTRPDGGRAYAVAYDPTTDRVYTGGADGFIRGWTTHAPELVSEWYPGGRVSAIDVNPNGGRLVADGGNEITLWDVETGEPTRTLTSGGGYLELRWSPDGTRVAINDYTRIFDAQTGEELVLSTSGSTVAWSPDGSRLAVGGIYDASTRTWAGVSVFDAYTAALIADFPTEFHHVEAVAWSPDGSALLIGGARDSAGYARHEVWGLGASPELLHRTDSRSQNRYFAVQWSSSGEFYMTAGEGDYNQGQRGIAVYRATDGSFVLGVSDHQSGVLDAVWTPDMSAIYSTDWDGVLIKTEVTLGAE